MTQTHTGPQRLRGGLAPGWTISHKTGTGQVLGSVQAGYNDIGILHAPDGHHYALAVMIGRTCTPLADADGADAERGAGDDRLSRGDAGQAEGGDR